MAVETLVCDVCGDLVSFDPEPVVDEDGDIDVDVPICNCCYSVICEKHTATPSCPHSAADHDQPAPPTARESAGEG